MNSSFQKDEMEVEHLATLERLRQSQRQDYLKVNSLLYLTISFLMFFLFFVSFL